MTNLPVAFALELFPPVGVPQVQVRAFACLVRQELNRTGDVNDVAEDFFRGRVAHADALSLTHAAPAL
jgi:hypothetical protein